tara:strand:- start:265 stop:495 length:231 start_codon:yes stop_codon:yes gene_type:complete
MTNYKRKYQYPIEFITKRGTLKKNKKRKVNEWIQDMKNFNMKSYNELKLENYFLKIQIKDYSEALEDWVLVAQSQK